MKNPLQKKPKRKTYQINITDDTVKAIEKGAKAYGVTKGIYLEAAVWAFSKMKAVK